MSKKALVIGATGATGTALVAQLLDNEKYVEVHIFVRRKVELKNPKLQVHVVDFDAIDDWKEKLKGDELYAAMGTCLKTAGSKEAQYKIDYTYQFEVAKAAAEYKLPSYSSVRLDPAVSRHFSTLKSKGNWKMPSAN